VAKKADEVFLNVPYDHRFENLFLAYVAGLTALGFVPRATLEIPGSDRRLEKIFALIGRCEYSIHDLSRVELDRSAPRVPRFNMPFELGLTVARLWKAGAHEHAWFVCESTDRRLLKSLSDLNGTDAYIHGGRADGVLRELLNMFELQGEEPSLPFLARTYQKLRQRKSAVLQASGSITPFTMRAFRGLCLAAKETVDELAE